MSNVLDTMAQMAEATGTPKDAQLARVSEMAAQQVQLEIQIEAAEQAVKTLKEAYKRLSEFELPMYLKSIGLSSFGLTDGNQISVSTEYYANISEERRAAAHLWLRENRHGDLIKNLVIIDIGRGGQEKVEAILKIANEQGVEAEIKESVNPATLKAFVKEQVQKDAIVEPGSTRVPLPRELFGVFEKDVTEIKPPKKGKKK